MATIHTDIRPSTRKPSPRQPETKTLDRKLRARDEQVTHLLTDLDSCKTRIQSLQKDAQNAETEKHHLADALGELHSQYSSLRQRTNKQFDLHQSGGEELQETKQRIETLQKELAGTKEESKQLQVAMAKQGTVGGRKDKWTESERRLAEYRDALTGMEQEIEDHKAAAAEQERDNCELALKIASLERRCAELDGRRSEREDANTELRAALDNRNEELERLTKNVSRMQKDVTKLNIGIRTGQTSVASSISEIARPDKEIAALAKASEKERNLSANPLTQSQTAANRIDKSQRRSQEHDDVNRQSDTDCVMEPLLADKSRQPQKDANSEELDGIYLPEQYFIVPVGHDDPETQYPLNKNELTFGRSRDNDIPIFDDSVSRVHARVILEELRVFIEDMGSKNGILVNSEPKQRHELRHSDRFTIGRKEFELVDLGIRGSPARTTSAA